MTCRLEVVFKGTNPVPRTCPECGLSGRCARGFTQVTRPAGLGGYTIIPPNGSTDEPVIVFNDIHHGIEGAKGEKLTNAAVMAEDPFRRGSRPDLVPGAKNIDVREERFVSSMKTKTRLLLIDYLLKLKPTGDMTLFQLDTIVDDIEKLMRN